MTQLAEEKLTYLSNFRALEKQAAGTSGRPWIDEIRQAAMDRFAEAGFPSKTDEDWRQTNVAAIARIPFRSAALDDAVTEEQVRPFSFRDEAATELVFVNGVFVPELSSLTGLPRGVHVASLSGAIETASTALQNHLSRLAKIDANPFVALNTGFVREGAVVQIDANAVCELPVHLLFLSTAGDEPAVSHPRVLVVAGANSSAAVVETYAGIGSGVYFTNAVSEYVVADNAQIDQCRLQQETNESFHVSTTQVQLGRTSRFVSHSATLGGQLTRNDLNVVLAGEGAEATVNGLVIIGGKQHADNHTLLDHAAPNCPSHELYKHVLDDHATGVFRGKILVRQIAQKTDSKQTSRSLLLSDDAAMNSQPALEIYADDVKCTHGSTTGPVDEEMIFYFRSRGVGLEAARHLLTYAFAADITRRIRVEAVRRRLENFMAARHGLPQDLRITDLGRHDEKHR